LTVNQTVHPLLRNVHAHFFFSYTLLFDSMVLLRVVGQVTTHLK